MEILAQTIPMGDVTGFAVERLGTVGLIVAGCYALVKYFMVQLEKKDARLNDVTDRSVSAQQQVVVAIERLTGAIDNLQERRTAQRDQ